MRYKSIELCNYAGIYNGMGLNQIKIDFTKCVTNKVIIRGKNGSGKSTLLNAINPNPDSNDNFIPDAEARKTIVLTDNGIDYIIRYIHPVTSSGRGTTRGYISKLIDGAMVELNPNGNISSCRDIIYDEFNLDSNYISLAKLTTENRGLVDSRPAERKKLVNSIIHNLETYNNIFRILSKKSSAYKSLINSLTSKIDYIGDESKLRAKLGNICGRLGTLEDEKATTVEAIAAIKLRISEYIKILKDNNYDSVVQELRDLNGTVRTLRKSIMDQLGKYGINDITTVEAFLNNINNQISVLDSKRSSIRESIPAAIAERESEYEQLQSKQEKMNGLMSDYNYADIKKAIDENRHIVDECMSVFNQMKLANIDVLTKSEFDLAMEALRYLKEYAEALTSAYQLTDISYVVHNRSKAQDNVSSIQSLKARLDQLSIELSSLRREYDKGIVKREIASQLDIRPKDCKIDSCPYIESAIKADLECPKERITSIEEQIVSIEGEIDEIQQTITLYTTYSEILGYISAIERELSSKMPFINKLPIRSDFRESFFDRVINLDRFDDINDLYMFVDCSNLIERYKIAKEHLHKYTVESKLYESNNSIIESLLSDINMLNDRITKLSEDIDDKHSTVSELNNQISSLEVARDKMTGILSKINDTLIPSEKRQEELSGIKETLESNTSELDTLNEELSTLNVNLAKVNGEIKSLTDEKDSIKHSLIMLDDYKKELEQYKTNYTKIDKLKYYSSSTTGIQTLYMQLYMNNILSTANNLLSLLFEGEFVLQPFIINEQEFRIPCLGSGLLHDDISSMSTAQKSMISMILSYSILYQSSSKYNIISLDEMDGSLDGSNRIYFMTLLDKLMSILKCEQCFIISHNSELISELADIVMLVDVPGANYGGNIIWSY